MDINNNVGGVAIESTPIFGLLVAREQAATALSCLVRGSCLIQDHKLRMTLRRSRDAVVDVQMMVDSLIKSHEANAENQALTRERQ